MWLTCFPSLITHQTICFASHSHCNWNRFVLLLIFVSRTVMKPTRMVYPVKVPHQHCQTHYRQRESSAVHYLCQRYRPLLAEYSSNRFKTICIARWSVACHSLWSKERWKSTSNINNTHERSNGKFSILPTKIWDEPEINSSNSHNNHTNIVAIVKRMPLKIHFKLNNNKNNHNIVGKHRMNEWMKGRREGREGRTEWRHTNWMKLHTRHQHIL